MSAGAVAGAAGEPGEQRRAAQHGQSFQQYQQYLAGELKRLAERPSLDDVLERIERRRGGRVGLAQAAEDLSDERTGW